MQRRQLIHCIFRVWVYKRSWQRPLHQPCVSLIHLVVTRSGIVVISAGQAERESQEFDPATWTNSLVGRWIHSQQIKTGGSRQIWGIKKRASCQNGVTGQRVKKTWYKLLTVCCMEGMKSVLSGMCQVCVLECWRAKWEAGGGRASERGYQARSNILSTRIPRKAYGDLPLQYYGIDLW